MPEVFYYLKPSASLPRNYENQVLITNVLSFIFFGVTLGILAIFYSTFGWISPLPYILMVALLFLMIPGLNRWLSHKLGRVAFCLIPVWLTMVVTIHFKLTAPEAITYVTYFDSRFILMAAAILPGIVFRIEERAQIFLCVASISVFIFLYDPIHELFGAGYYQRGFNDPSYQYINYIVSVTYSVLLFGIFLLRSTFEKSEKEVLTQNHELIEKQNEIEAQHEELLQQQEEVLASSEKLEQANRMILSQQVELQKYNDTLEALVEEKNADLIATNEELVKYNNELLQFSYTVSHNLRGPVARMLGLTRLLKKSDAADRTKLEDLILRSTEELDEILKDLSLIIDIRNDIYSVREKVYLQDEWNKAMSLVGDGTRSIFDLQVSFDDAPYIFGVRPMVQSIFYNLLSNAIKYQSPDRKLNVIVQSSRTDNNVTILKISDNGLGIDLKAQEKNVFKLYKRFHTHVGGKGLGLYLVKTQVETLGGNIQVESELDSGTTFTIRFSPPEQVDRQLFYDQDAARLYYDGNQNIIVIKWNRSPSGNEFRQVFHAVLSSLNVYHSPGWISDVREQGMINESDQAWLVQTILPQLASCGLRFVAMVGNDQTSRSEYFKKLQAACDLYAVTLRYFDDFDAARAWMETILVTISARQDVISR